MQSFENSLKQLEPYDYVRRKIQEKNQCMLIRTQCATSTEEQTIRLTIANNDPLQWPPLKTTPINELNTKGLVTMVLPTSGPPMVSLLDSEYKTETRVTQSSVYIEQHPCDASLTVEQLQEMVGTMSCMQSMNRLQRYATEVLGSKQYWYTRYQELKALLEQKDQQHSFGQLAMQTTTGQHYIPYYQMVYKQTLHKADKSLTDTENEGAACRQHISTRPAGSHAGIPTTPVVGSSKIPFAGGELLVHLVLLLPGIHGNLVVRPHHQNKEPETYHRHYYYHDLTESITRKSQTDDFTHRR